MELSERKKRIDDELQRFFSSQDIGEGEIEKVFSEIPAFILRGGKRVRPALFLEGYKIGGGERIDECLRASLSIELCHNYFLMHDDVMDRDAFRRGGKTLHKAYESDFDSWTSVSLAINTGDYTNTLSFQSILVCDFPKDRKFEVVKELVETQKRVYEGQCLDLILHETPLSKVEVEEVLQVHRLKTASYTVACPLRMGFLLSPRAREPASSEIAESLGVYGREVGTAFQVKDDLLGLFGEEEETGKPVTSDIEEGKRTLPLVIAYRRGTESQKEEMKSIVGKKLSENEFKTIREIVKKTDAKRESEEMAEEMVEEGKRAVGDIESDFLVDLADFIIERSY
ncbi:hypothetical protein AKJ41_03425 [candidate division MSBL1 archaeon SCGC-AAA259O05]|uniref:Polyprenyl synthetase n=1 Tax=candidate division MSBL1 archaeon SCGC-AAA259O05 TaxID=1698271 RepID=A0A133V391_9EURY|nr:hypothetical protein AKJ41_03425 [candidate division MSBL1 archaeon SCGC-AAA259O05]